MNVIAQTQVVVHNNGAQSFEWKGYGLKLLIPCDALPRGLESCIITIRVGLSGQFQLPRHYDIISAVYDIRTTAELARPIAIEIDHCAHCISPRYFTFAVAKSQMGPPYMFELLPGGLFAPSSRYGKISVQQFSLFSILRYIGSFQWLFPAPSVCYCAQVYYVCEQITDWRLHFIITRDLPDKVCVFCSYLLIPVGYYDYIHMQVVSARNHERAVKRFNFAVEFDDCEIIELKIPEGTICGDWMITPLHYPGVSPCMYSVY